MREKKLTIEKVMAYIASALIGALIYIGIMVAMIVWIFKLIFG